MNYLRSWHFELQCIFDTVLEDMGIQATDVVESLSLLHFPDHQKVRKIIQMIFELNITKYSYHQDENGKCCIHVT